MSPVSGLPGKQYVKVSCRIHESLREIRGVGGCSDVTEIVDGKYNVDKIVSTNRDISKYKVVTT